MNIQLTKEQVEDINTLLEGSLRDLSEEIAGTDNAAYRRVLKARRDRLSDAAHALRSVLELSIDEHGTVLLPSRELMAERAHPGG